MHAYLKQNNYLNNYSVLSSNKKIITFKLFKTLTVLFGIINKYKV